MRLFHTNQNTGIAEIKKYIGKVSVVLQIADLDSHFSSIEDKFVKDILGDDEFESLCQAFADDALEPEQELLLPYCQKIIANLGYLAHLPLGNAYFTAYGIQAAQTKETQVASQWRLRDIKNSFAYDGFNAIEELLEFLWKSPEDTYPDWELSENRERHRSFFIISAKQFNEDFWIDDAYQLYRMFKPAMKKVETYYIKPVLGAALFNEIKQQIKDDNVSEDNEFLLTEFIRPAVADITFFEAAPRLRIDISDFGLSQRRTSDRQTEDVREPLNNDSYKDGVNSSERNGQMIIGDLREYLFANHTEYPLYEASTSYTKRVAEEDFKTLNGNKLNTSEDNVIGLF